MKKSASKINDYQTKYDQKFTDSSISFKTTNINILLNRVKLENKDKIKKKIIFLISIIGILSFLSFILLGD